MFRREMAETLEQRLTESRQFIQVLVGPRQTGKTTIARQVMKHLTVPVRYATADEPALKQAGWMEQQWELARLTAKPDGVLILDEIHKLPGWAETVKRLWDADSMAAGGLRVVLLGSSPLLMQKGLTESLAGRFELIRVPHWDFDEMSQAFGYTFEEYVVLGGYPGAASLREDFARWRSYILDALVETAISRDILLMTRVDKPALLRRTYELACAHSGQILSFQKMVGQLQDAGNTTTIAHYLNLLGAAGLVCGLPKYHGGKIPQRASSPKLQVLNNALITAQTGIGPAQAPTDRPYWGRLVESAVGAHLANRAGQDRFELSYWRNRGREVDFVVSSSGTVTALEVKTGRVPTALPGMTEFERRFRPARCLVIGPEALPAQEFLATTPRTYL